MKVINKLIFILGYNMKFTKVAGSELNLGKSLIS